ncbi:hypothetical protein E1263_10365 [Kribbella antibiotica]|uniref:Uncharacterized protein n=1 Tax=Kribbella antibiotica TaxID=190195 RepID=A0A4R4ZQQ7_9ACTN|nr:hypothetical protein [Kribbella antibiotica]TDD60670.1 hypothetical protein E1263_10365 [Kribbella antibiotica]
MSSQRVVSFELTEAQRAQVRRVVALNRDISTGRVERARKRMLAQLDRLTATVPAVALPSRAAVDAAFDKTTDADRPSGETVVLAKQLSQARASTATDDRLVESLLVRVPAIESLPEAVTTAVAEVRSATAAQRGAAVETLKEAVEAAIARCRDREQSQVELDHATAISDALSALGNELRESLRVKVKQLQADIAAAAERHAGGDDVVSKELVVSATKLRKEFSQDEDDAHTLAILAGLWRDLGYEVDVGADLFVAHAGHDRGVAVRVVNGAAIAQQVGITNEHGQRRTPTPGSHDAVCAVAAQVEQRAGKAGLQATHCAVENDERTPLATAVVRTITNGSVAEPRHMHHGE